MSYLFYRPCHVPINWQDDDRLSDRERARLALPYDGVTHDSFDSIDSIQSWLRWLLFFIIHSFGFEERSAVTEAAFGPV